MHDSRGPRGFRKGNEDVEIELANLYHNMMDTSSKPPPFATMLSTCVQLQTKSKTTHVVATCFLQLLTNNVNKYKSKI
jgi:hypothetical protein